MKYIVTVEPRFISSAMVDRLRLSGDIPFEFDPFLTRQDRFHATAVLCALISIDRILDYVTKYACGLSRQNRLQC